MVSRDETTDHRQALCPSAADNENGRSCVGRHVSTVLEAGAGAFYRYRITGIARRVSAMKHRVRLVIKSEQEVYVAFSADWCLATAFCNVSLVDNQV
jgi:hypothetical protein